MKAKFTNWYVPIFKYLKKVHSMVDNYRIIVFILLLVSSVNLHGQNQKRVDSLLQVLEKQKDTTKINTYTQLFIEYIHVDPKKAKEYLDAEIDLAESINNKLFIGRTKMNYGIYLMNVSKFEESIRLFDVLINDFKALNNKKYQSFALVNKGNALRDLGRFEEAVEAHLESLKIKEEINDDTESIAISLWNIGNLQGDIGNTDKSTAYYIKSKVLFKELKSESDTIILNLNIAQNFQDTDRESEAIPLFKNAIGFFKKTNSIRDLGKIYEVLGLCYMTTDSLSTALDYFNKSLAISNETNETMSSASNLRHIGEVNLKQNNPRKALVYLEESLEKSKHIKAQNEIAKNYEALSETYAKIGNHKLAYKNHLEYTNIHESILNAESIEKMNELEIKYKSEKKEKELIIKENEIKLLDEHKEKVESQRLFLLITLIGILAFSVALIYGLRQRMKRNTLEHEKLDASLKFKEKELTTHALHLAHKNEVLLDLKSQFKDLKSESNNPRQYQNIINNINLDINNDSSWEQFRTYFEDVHKDFNSNIMKSYPEVSANDLRLMSLLKMNLSSKEIANILNISPEGVKKARYRLRKKLKLSTEESLQELVIEL